MLNSLELNICHVIKQNESKVANTVFKIQPNKADSLFCFLLFVQSLTVCIFETNCPISVGFSLNLSLNNTLLENAKKPNNHIFQHLTHLLDRITC